MSSTTMPYATALPPICWKLAPIFEPSRCCWDNRDLEETTIYLHLSRPHLSATGGPLDALKIREQGEQTHNL